jgi:hypothetical protein
MQDARERCAIRSRKYAEAMDAELVAMLKRSSIAFKNDDDDDENSKGGESSDDDDPLGRNDTEYCSVYYTVC